MSEKDLDLKVATRRLYWSMGMTTRLNVKLRTHVATSGGTSRSKTEEFTDLDVLGIGLSSTGKVLATIGDCKTVKKQANERCFWLRGVADFFAAGTAHLVRSHDVPISTRQLAERLSLGVLTEADLRSMEEWYQVAYTPEVAGLFESAAIVRAQRSASTLDSKLDRLVDYRDFGYWLVEPHRTLDGTIHQLHLAREHLDKTNPAHRSLLFDVGWLFCLSLTHAAAHIRDTYASNIELALTQYLFGGPAGHREKLNQAQLLARLVPKGSRSDLAEIRPNYFPGLLETLTRHLRRPHLSIEMLRYSEWLSFAAFEKDLRGIPVAAVYGSTYEPLAGKLLGDTVQFLLAAAQLDDKFSALIELTSPFAISEGTPSGKDLGGTANGATESASPNS
jgi:hypothetical protein